MVKENGVMETVLSKSVDRQQQLILYIARHYGWITAQELADYLDCNIKTVRQDVIYLEETYSDILSVEFSKKFGYRFHVLDGRNILEIYLQWIQDSLFFSILSDCFFEKNQTIDYFYDTYFISETTLKRQISAINRTLKSVGISISSSTGKMNVKDEKKLRFFFSLLSIEKRSIYEWTDIDMDQRNLFKIIELCETYFEFSLSIIQKNILSFFIYTSITRSSQYHFLDHLVDVPIEFHDVLENELRTLKHQETLDVFLTEEEQYRDSLAFIYGLFKNLSDEYRSKEIETVTQELVTLISDKMKVEVSVIDLEGVSKELAYVSFMNKEYPHPINLVSLRSELNARAIEEQYPVFYNIVSESLDELVQKNPWIKFYQFLLISRVFRYWDYREFESISKIKSVSIAISTTLEKNHADILAYILKQTFQTKVDVVFIEYGKTLFNSRENIDQLLDIDLVITNHLFYKELDNVVIVDDVIENYRLATLKRVIDTKLMTHSLQGLTE